MQSILFIIFLYLYLIQMYDYIKINFLKIILVNNIILIKNNYLINLIN